MTTMITAAIAGLTVFGTTYLITDTYLKARAGQLADELAKTDAALSEALERLSKLERNVNKGIASVRGS